ncbi:hypothetical protein O7627_33275 [Solwaraspora sp. WMMD1047]|uniref:hypothetical protein n=1 Tax=Solwaraspora sp. WMMD1047 TaxID=3016102 RepID=UPI002416E8D4|nr:hypothetical protein [Solwaraspora sp. WMMD1047]MDG4834138.1 hypothetical protein [Solwaraspora sp. WMMD1047]
MPTLPTPCARDGKGPGHQYGLPDLVEPTGTRHNLLPTPTAVAYGSNKSPSAGATRRPGPAGIAAQSLPAPAAAGGTGYLSGTRRDTWRQTMESAVRGYRPRRGGKPTTPPLLPTPRATDGTKGCPGQRGSHGDLTLPSAAVRVPARTLPTPRASDARGPGRHGHGGTDLRTTVAGLRQPDTDRWGAYAAAVARWELLLGRPVPEPTQPGQHGKPVLAPPFVEWLMGLDQHRVTDPALALPRTGALRVLGNGVVPQQAAAALRLLLCPYRWEVPA